MNLTECPEVTDVGDRLTSIYLYMRQNNRCVHCEAPLARALR
jgi:hypothetical protein